MPKNDDAGAPGAKEEANFVTNMKRLREEKGWSQGEMARKMSEAGWESFHQTTISRIEKGERPVRLGEARGIASALGALVGQMMESDFARSEDLILEGAGLLPRESKDLLEKMSESLQTAYRLAPLIAEVEEAQERASRGEHPKEA